MTDLVERLRRKDVNRMDALRERMEAAATISTLRAEVESIAKREAAVVKLAFEQQDRIKELEAAVTASHVAMSLALALPGVAAEYDFSDALAATEAALRSREGGA